MVKITTGGGGDDGRGRNNKLRLLICSANLGNAPPDGDALADWIPPDGRCRDAFFSSSGNGPRPPPPVVVVNRQRNHGSGGDDDDETALLHIEEDFEEYRDETEQFDLIVIGLQESTFDPPANDDSERNGGGFVGATGKKITALTNLATSRDYIAKKSSTVSSCGGVDSAAANGNDDDDDGGEISDDKKVASNKKEASLGHLPMLSPKDFVRVADKVIPKDQWMGGTHVLHAALDEHLPGYERIVSYQRGEMRLEIFRHRVRLRRAEVLGVAARNTGRGGLANKGGIVAELLVNGTTRLSFLTAHLEAHEGASKYRTRCSTVADILGGTKQQHKLHDVSLTSHFSFVMGDLNFRTELPDGDQMSDEEHGRAVRELVAARDWAALNDIDELHRALRQKDCLVGYRTLPCNFPPTFKVERRAGYHYTDKRRPSYTDRILWKANHELDDRARPLLYESIGNFASSDHKPVRAAFSIELNEPFAFRPKMSRRRSVMNLGWGMKRRGSSGGGGVGRTARRSGNIEVAHKERMHLFLSNMQCNIAPQAASSAPNPYICLVSDPEGSLRYAVKSRWSFLKKIVLRHGSKELTRSLKKTAKGWPRSSSKKQTYQPEWDEEEIHVEVKTHGPDGAPLDLTGAMLHLTVMDKKQSSDDVVLGSFTFNLVNLVRKCRPSSEESSRRIIQTRTARRTSHAARHSGGGRRMSLAGMGKRMSTIFTGKSGDVSEELDEEDGEDPITTIHIDEPLLRNGVETGRIRCQLEAWWMDEATAKTVGTAGLFGHHHAHAHSIGRGSITEDGTTPKTMLSGRKETRLSQQNKGKRGGAAKPRAKSDNGMFSVGRRADKRSVSSQ
jgi:hypothetical protein